jgi:hypothetical protein
VASPGGKPGTARFDCHTLRWLLPLVLAPLVVLVALLGLGPAQLGMCWPFSPSPWASW